MTDSPTPSRTGWCSAGQHRLCRRPYTCGCDCDPILHGVDRRCEVSKPEVST